MPRLCRYAPACTVRLATWVSRGHVPRSATSVLCVPRHARTQRRRPLGYFCIPWARARARARAHAEAQALLLSPRLARGPSRRCAYICEGGSPSIMLHRGRFCAIVPSAAALGAPPPASPRPQRMGNGSQARDYHSVCAHTTACIQTHRHATVIDNRAT